jgi:hypothetical protein
VLEVVPCMNHEEVRHLRHHMHFRNTDRHRTCRRKGGDAEVTSTYTRYEGDDETKETDAKGSKVISFHLLWAYCLGRKSTWPDISKCISRPL